MVEAARRWIKESRGERMVSEASLRALQQMECRERGRGGKIAPRFLGPFNRKEGACGGRGWNTSGGEGIRNSALDLGVGDAYLVC